MLEHVVATAAIRRRLTVFALCMAMVGWALAFVHRPARAGDPVSDLLGTPVSLAQVDPGVGGFMSPNISYLGTIPLDSPGVGARVVTVQGQRRLYVTGVRGLSIYDLTDPALPLLLSHLELPGWENEDVAVSADGKTVLVSGDAETYLWVIDTHVVRVPIIRSFTVGIGGHTVTCADAACNWVYGSSGHIIDLRNKTKPVLQPEDWTKQTGLPSGHNLDLDASGVMWTDTTPIGALDVSNPIRPKLIATGRAPATAKTAYQHNTIRPNADKYVPRPAAERNDPKLRPGEILLGNGETNFEPQCGDANGPFATYRVDGFERGGKDAVRLIEVFRPVNGDYLNGNPAFNVMGCSGHWFTVHPDQRLVAAGWYEHGTRLLDINPTSGKITQIGYFQPVIGAASAAHWVNDEYIYVVDYARGIDILHYDKNASAPTAAMTQASWLAKLNVVDPLAQTERWICTLAANGPAKQPLIFTPGL